MPTASAAKLEKQASLDANDPLKQGIIMVDHKIRNLEKRKLKLDGYRDLQKSGKDLNSDQLEAISKYDAVIQHLEFAKELSKNLSNLALDAAKNAKKQARKEALERAQQDLQRTKEMLMIQDVLSNMGQDNVREDFLQGKAKVTLTPEELQHIDDLYLELSAKREEHTHFQEMFQGPAEVMSHLLEGKNKEVVSTTYAALKTKLLEIANSGYFDSAQTEAQQEPVVTREEPAEEVPPPPVIPIDPPPPTVISAAPYQTSGGAVVTQLVAPPVVAIQQQQVPLAEEMRSVPPQPIETTYFTPSHLRVFQSGTIDFMQENELDTPEAPPIPTMTYTNQSYTPNSSQKYEPAPQQPVVPQPEPPQPIYHTLNSTGVVAVAVEEESGWGVAEVAAPPAQPQQDASEGWEEETSRAPVDDSWASQSDWGQPQHTNDGFITQGGRGRGGRGRGGDRKGGNFNSNSGGGGGGRPGGRGRGGYNREGGGSNRDGGGYGGGGGGYKEQNSYQQNGYQQNRGERGGRGGRGGASQDRQGGGGRGRGGGRGYRGGNSSGGGYRQQQQQI